MLRSVLVDFICTDLAPDNLIVDTGRSGHSDRIAIILTAYTARTLGLVLAGHTIKRELVSKPVTLW